MWIYQMSKIAGGNTERIAELAARQGLTHLFVRVGSGRSGLNTLNEAASILPHAHKRNIRVIAWYFPYFNNIPADVARSVTAMNTTRYGQRFDGFAADIESANGSALSATTADTYSRALRAALPAAYLIAVPPRPTEHTLKRFPYDSVIPHYDAVAPMVYWGRFDPAESVRSTMTFLSKYGKPVSPIGQTYDMGSEGGPKGNPPPHQIWAFMRESKRLGADGVSFWSWQHATAKNWWTIRQFDWTPPKAPAPPVRLDPCRLWIDAVPATKTACAARLKRVNAG